MASATCPAFESTDLAAARRGAALAWHRIVRRYEHLALAVPRRLGLSEADAEEVAQATWISLYRSIDTLRHPEALPAWIATTASRESWRVRRSAQRRDEAESGTRDAEPHAEDPSSAVERSDLGARVRAALSTLRPEYARLVELLYLTPGEHAYADVAAEMGLPVGSIGPMRLRALAQLARALEARGVRAPDPD